MEIILEDNLILQNYIEKFFQDNNSHKKVELIIKPECNQTCEYCYLYQHGKELYPIEKRKSNEDILNNINLFFNYLINNNIYIKIWDIFAGDLFYDNLWFSIMDLFYNYYIKIQSQQEIIPAIIMMPNNFSFCHFDDKIKKVKEYIEKFKLLKIKILFSYSSDGKYSTNIREKRILTDEYYDKVFTLMGENGWGAHPMISYEGIDNSIQNYDWWMEQYKKYIIPNNPHDFMPGFLEVRNNGWTEESIDKYLQLLNHIIWKRFEMCHYNSKELMQHLFYPAWYLNERGLLPRHDMDLIHLDYSPLEENIMKCAIGHQLVINCADLSFVPCHRTSYSFFTGGKFSIKNNQIIGVEALEGLNGYFNQVSSNTSFNLKCYGCPNRFFCMQGCRGAQFEYSMETFLPIPSVCNLLDKKITFLVQRYHELGIFHELFSQTDLFIPENYKKDLLKLLKSRGYNEYECRYL